jgi:hypothetical protein
MKLVTTSRDDKAMAVASPKQQLSAKKSNANLVIPSRDLQFSGPLPEVYFDSARVSAV